MEEPLTRIILVHETGIADEPDVFHCEDPRPHRAIVKAVNTGAQVIGLEPDPTGGEARVTVRARQTGEPWQWAVSHDPIDSVTVVEQLPPVLLSPRQYDVLFGLADGLSVEQIARRLSISARTGYLYLAELKERFGAQSTAQLVARAMEVSMLPMG